ncbi:hypothetical protein ACTXT7_005709 [Hymenolepis weldensis]
MESVIAFTTLVHARDHLPGRQWTAVIITNQHGDMIYDVEVEYFNSSADVHSAILSGGLYHSSSADELIASKCDQIIRSKLSPHFEPLWLTNQRQGMKSGSFYWPDDFVAVNKSRPAFAVGSNPTARSAYFDTKMIHRWLLNPSITFMSIFIPPPPVLRDSEFMYNYVEYVDEFISTLLLIIKKSSQLNSSVSIIFIGGTAVVNNQNNFETVPIRKIFKQWPLSAFGNHFKQAHLLEFWPTPSELQEDDLRLLDEQNPDYFSCSTTEFRQQNPNFDTGLLPPYYLVAKSGKVLHGKSFISYSQKSVFGEAKLTNVGDLGVFLGLRVISTRDYKVDAHLCMSIDMNGQLHVSTDSRDPEITSMPQSSPFVLLWGKAFTKSPEVCGFSQSKSISPIQLYDIYPMVCWALGLHQPWLNWGKLSRVKKYLKNHPSDAQVAEFEGRYRDWNQINGGIIAALALALAITFIACALKHHRRYNSLHPVGNNIASVRYKKRRIRRPWLGSVQASGSGSHHGLLGNHRDGGGFALDESEEEEVLMENDLSARENRRREKESADAYIQMLHSPTGNRSTPSMTLA